jgi:hypothetical protein
MTTTRRFDRCDQQRPQPLDQASNSLLSASVLSKSCLPVFAPDSPLSPDDALLSMPSLSNYRETRHTSFIHPWPFFTFSPSSSMVTGKAEGNHRYLSKIIGVSYFRHGKRNLSSLRHTMGNITGLAVPSRCKCLCARWIDCTSSLKALIPKRRHRQFQLQPFFNALADICFLITGPPQEYPSLIAWRCCVE